MINCLYDADPIGYAGITSIESTTSTSTSPSTTSTPSTTPSTTSSTSERGKFTVQSTEHLEITRDMLQDEHVASVLLPYQNEVSGNMLKIIGESAVPLDCSFKSIRTQETAISNFVADCVCHSMVSIQSDAGAM
jgi:hypothetical protein